MNIASNLFGEILSKFNTFSKMSSFFTAQFLFFSSFFLFKFLFLYKVRNEYAPYIINNNVPNEIRPRTDIDPSILFNTI